MNKQTLLMIAVIASSITLTACEPTSQDQAGTTPPTAVASDSDMSTKKQTAGEAVEKARQAARTEAIVEQTDAKIRAADRQLREATEQAKRQSNGSAAE